MVSQKNILDIARMPGWQNWTFSTPNFLWWNIRNKVAGESLMTGWLSWTKLVKEFEKRSVCVLRQIVNLDCLQLNSILKSCIREFEGFWKLRTPRCIIELSLSCKSQEGVAWKRLQREQVKCKRGVMHGSHLLMGWKKGKMKFREAISLWRGGESNNWAKWDACLQAISQNWTWSN